MARVDYKFNKQQRVADKQRVQQEKRIKRLERRQAWASAPDTIGESS
ncbi:MAG: hypothetical protein RJQ08_16710 [Salinisphaeraceae bacterium]